MIAGIRVCLTLAEPLICLKKQHIIVLEVFSVCMFFINKNHILDFFGVVIYLFDITYSVV